MKQQTGISVIELLIVVSMVLIIAAIAVPNSIRSRMAANESSAAAAFRAIGSANAMYSSIYNQGFAGTLVQLGPTSAACNVVSSACADLLDSVLAGVHPATPRPVKNGYTFTYLAPNATPSAAAPNKTYSVTATPLRPRSSGASTFCLDQSNVVKQDTAGATPTGNAAGCDVFAGNAM